MFAVYPNRQFPQPGQPLTYLATDPPPLTDQQGIPVKNARNEEIKAPIQPESQWLVRLIEYAYRPVRIASIHAHSLSSGDYGVDAPGIFVDPRYDYDPKGQQPYPIELEEPALLRQYETNGWKFDIVRDPAFPVIGLFQFFNERMAHGPWDVQTLQQVKTPLAQAAQLLRQEQKIPDNQPETKKAKHQEVMNTFTQTAQFLQIDLDKDYWQQKTPFSARSGPGKADDYLALALAEQLKGRKDSTTDRELVYGNHLGGPLQVVHYSASAGKPAGFSLGDWAPVRIGTNPTDPGYMPGAPDFTVEVFAKNASGAFSEDGRQLYGENGEALIPTAPKQDRKRLQDLQAYADALMTVFLEP